MLIFDIFEHGLLYYWRFRQHKRICTVTNAKVSLCKCADSPEPSVLAQNGIQSPLESPHENFEL